MSQATEAQKLKIVRTAQDMARDANMKSEHGRAIRAAAFGFRRGHIPASLTKSEASALIQRMEQATEFFGSNASAVMEVAKILAEMKSR